MAGCNLPRTLAGEVSHATESTWLAGGRTWCTHTCAQVPALYCTIKAACKDEWLARVTLQRHDRLHTHRQVGSCRKRNVLLSGSDNDPCSQVLTNKSTRKIQEMVFLVTCDLVVDALSPSADFLQITNCTATDFADKASQSRRLQLVSFAWTWHAPSTTRRCSTACKISCRQHCSMQQASDRASLQDVHRSL